jgi:excisionase family DNA binding protein
MERSPVVVAKARSEGDPGDIDHPGSVMSRTKTKSRGTEAPAAGNGLMAEVLTLPEAATYLRVSEAEVLQMVREQELPARRVGTEWRFLKNALQEWLGRPRLKSKSQGIWAVAGSWKNDPYLDELLKEIYRRRERPMTEGG